MVWPSLNQRVIRSVLRVAIDHRRFYPLCKKRGEATQACGSAVASLSLGVIKDGLSHLVRQAQVECTSRSSEGHFDDTHVADHVNKVNVLVVTFLRLTGRPVSNRANTGASNSAARVFAELPREHTRTAQERLDKVQDTLNDTVSCLVEARIKAREKKLAEAKDLIKIRAAGLLAATATEMGAAVREFEALRGGLTNMWRGSVHTIRRDPTCKPSPEQHGSLPSQKEQKEC
ncbi:MAG: hypothetical protein A2Y76_05355 [Planctomycetes bacterium RBG_13_60_9]|nr:MAG: hypothetical protein A2Y76_05355 [Planctomycetes bacterium RBG_13_60_9]